MEEEEELPESRSLLDTESLVPNDSSELEAAAGVIKPGSGGTGPSAYSVTARDSGRSTAMAHGGSSRASVQPGPPQHGTKRDIVATSGSAREICSDGVSTYGPGRPGNGGGGVDAGPVGVGTTTRGGGGGNLLQRSHLLCLQPDLSESLGRECVFVLLFWRLSYDAEYLVETLSFLSHDFK